MKLTDLLCIVCRDYSGGRKKLDTRPGSSSQQKFAMCGGGQAGAAGLSVKAGDQALNTIPRQYHTADNTDSSYNDFPQPRHRSIKHHNLPAITGQDQIKKRNLQASMKRISEPGRCVRTAVGVLDNPALVPFLG